MGIFGALDVDDIPDNPFWIEKGEYEAFVSNAYFHTNEKRDNQRQLVICYKITDKESKFYDKEVRDWFDVFPDLTKEDYNAMPGQDQAKIDRSLGSLKRRLCGQSDSKYNGLGVDVSELSDPNWDPKTLKNKQVIVAIKNYGEDDSQVGIKWVSVVED